MEVILEIDINESYVWQLVYQDLLLPCRAFIDPRSSTRKIGRFDELISIYVNKENFIAAASSCERVPVCRNEEIALLKILIAF